MAYITSTEGCEAAYKTLLSAHMEDVVSVDLMTGSGISVRNQSDLIKRFGGYSLRRDGNVYYAEVYHNGVRWYALLVREELTEKDLEILERSCVCR